MALAEYQTVRIKALLRESDAYDPFDANDRSPSVGDTGIIVDVQGLEAGQSSYTVERGRPDGTCIWLAEFVDEELEAVEEDDRWAETEEAAEKATWPPETQWSEEEATRLPESEEPETAGLGWRMITSIVLMVPLFLALAVAGIATVFFLWPPDSAVGAGLRSAATISILTLGGGLLVRERLIDLLITTTIVTVIFFVLGAVIWSQWTAG